MFEDCVKFDRCPAEKALSTPGTYAKVLVRSIGPEN